MSRFRADRWLLPTMAAALLLLQAGTRCDASEFADLGAFHSQVLLAARDTLPQESLKVLCQTRIKWSGDHDPGAAYVSFLGIGGPPALVVTLTTEELKHPERDVWLMPRVMTAGDEEVKRARKMGRVALPHSSAGWMKDWGFVFDRNQDGRVDYLSFLDGPTLLLAEDLPADFPRNFVELQRSPDHVSSNLAELLFAFRYAFHHVIDEDFDGRPDLFAHASFGQDSSWFSDGSFALRSRMSASIDSAWYFSGDLSIPTGVPDRSGDGYSVPMWPDTERKTFTAKDFSRWSDRLAAINSAAVKCACAFSKGPVPRRR